MINDCSVSDCSSVQLLNMDAIIIKMDTDSLSNKAGFELAFKLSMASILFTHIFSFDNAIP